MTLIEKWNSIVSDFQTNKTSREDVIQNLWVEIFADAAMFGYSKRSGEIDIWRNIQIGARERTIPDIIIRDSVNNKDLFVVELKQHNLPFSQTYKEQLLSYMRLLELKVGILICDKLYVYYRGNDTAEYSIVISFTENNANGEKFLALFSKGNFSPEKVKDFLIETAKTDSNISKIEQDVQQLDIKALLTEHYSKKYSLEEINLALKNFQISIIKINSSPTPPQPLPLSPGNGKDTTKYLFNGIQYGKGKLVLAVVKKYMQDHPSTSAQLLQTIFPKELQGSIGVVKLLSETSINCHDPAKRFYLNDVIQTSTQDCAVCSQWGIDNINNFIKKAGSLGMEITEIQESYYRKN